MRSTRKIEHIENYLKTEYVGDTLFSDVFIQHNALPNLDMNDISTKTNFLDKILDFPLMINSMTGGAEISYGINSDLGELSKEFNIAMATGSEKVALEKTETASSFEVVREKNPDGVVISNLNANESLEEAQNAVDLINADALQLHLNPAQELAMEGGDRNFKGTLDNIGYIVEKLSVPVIVKEVGFGISRSNAEDLYEVGVRYIDIAGAGGTNFLEIEDLRGMDTDYTDLYEWGSPTAYVLETYRGLPDDLTIIASGGIKTSLDLAKALVMGADIVAISGEILNYLLHGSKDYASDYIEKLIYKVKIIMLLLGAANIDDLHEVDYRVTGRLKDLLGR